ncbi:siderophore-interacting protein [Bosea sp. BK604]|uniref:siderophore-interacting protein n=1 Tax=Bosea sp. BK604 TaxID=2512180 RepID=UPI00104314A1|nr:siderophore-interacting protein [Bosea sp. BK604]TCR66356.1 NADPH-dependent ferric siderophore reductase [Bosea sp. BK604]
MTDLVAYCRFSGAALEALAGQLDAIDRLGAGGFRVSCERSRQGLCLSLSAADWRRLALAKARIAGEIRRMPGCANLALAWAGDGDPERLGHVQRWHVSRASQVTPHLRRISFAVEDAAFYAGDLHHVRLLLPQRHGGVFAYPKPCPAGLPVWPEGELMPVLRNYTIRSVRTELGEVDVDFVLHEPAGPATAWARDCRPGDEIGALGPIGQPISHAPLRILAGDETALPTILRQIEECRPGEAIDAYVALADDAERQEVALPEACRLHWLRYGDLVDALQARPCGEGDGVFAYSGTELATSQRLKSVFGGDLGLPRGQFRCVAYWRAQGAIAP